MKNGIDVSYANGKIDWSKVKTDFVMMRCNVGVQYPDNQFTRNAILAAEYGIQAGYYHWCTLNNKAVVTDAKSEAEEFIYQLKWVPTPFICALDIEEKNKLKIPPSDIELYIETFMTEMKKAKRKTLLYSFPSWLNENLNKNHKLGKYPLWISHIDTAKPMIPNGWTDWTLWQHSWKGKVDGIKGDVDLNYMK